MAYREVLLPSFAVATLALACVLSNLDMEMDPVTKSYQAVTELLPLVLLLVRLVSQKPTNLAIKPLTCG